MSVDLSIVVVNFNSARFLPMLADSIRAQEWRVDGRPGTWELIVVDNASRGDDAWHLRELARADERIRFIQNTSNVGYGQANNQGFHVGRGVYHLILNPDALLLPGCLEAMVGYLAAHPEAGIVGPGAFMDLEATVMMPPNQLPTPDLFAQQTRGQTDVDVARANLAERTRITYEYWTATEPYPMDMLSGSCLLFRHELFADGWPFDPGFPLYYEDTDLFMRVRGRGFDLVHLPAAKMLHFWSQSADTNPRGAQYRCRLSERRYYRKYFGKEGLRVYESYRTEALRNREEGRHVVPFDAEPIQAGAEPPVFRVDPGHRNYYVEFAGNPIFTLAAGMFPVEDGTFTVGQQMWNQLGPGSYYIRIIDKNDLETVHTWMVTKS